MKIALIRFAAVLLLSLATAGAALAQTGMTRDQMQRRYQVRMMEGQLIGAAQHGAELLALRVQQIDPSIMLLSGNPPRALGLVLEGHGIVFYVEVPSINPTIAWAMRNRGRDQVVEVALMAYKNFLQKLPEGQDRADLELVTRRLEQRLLPPGAAQRPNTGVMQMNGTAPPLATFAPPPPPMEDPDAEYERLVLEQLLNAMLDHSHQLGLGADEWLTVAARGSQGPLETVVDASVTLTLRIKGSDLAELRAGRITRDEARARVVVREF